MSARIFAYAVLVPWFIAWLYVGTFLHSLIVLPTLIVR